MEITIFISLIAIVFLYSRGYIKFGGKPKDYTRSKVPSNRKNSSNNWGMSDPRNQMEAISRVKFERVRLLNKSEYRVFRKLEGFLSELPFGYRLMAQTSLGELIKPVADDGDWMERKDAFASINSKRLDFVYIDKTGLAALAIEYQGAGHYQSGAFMRDAVKREALRLANVPLIEVEEDMPPSELKSRVLSAIQRQTVKANE